MKIKCLYMIFFLIISFTINAQNAALLPGTWAYEDIYEKEKLDVESLNMVQLLFSGLTFNFAVDGNYWADWGEKKESGKWSCNKKENLITLTSDKGKNSEMKIVAISENSLTVQIIKAIIILKKVDD